MSLSDCADVAQIATPVVAVLSFVFAFVRYFQARSREHRWKKTEFIFDQAKLIDQDREMNYAIAVLSDAREDCAVNDLFEMDGEFQKAADSKYKLGFEKLLNLLDRLAYAHLHAKVLEEEEMKNFLWYYAQVLEFPRIVKHCERNGFKDVVEMGKRLK